MPQCQEPILCHTAPYPTYHQERVGLLGVPVSTGMSCSKVRTQRSQLSREPKSSLRQDSSGFYPRPELNLYFSSLYPNSTRERWSSKSADIPVSTGETTTSTQFPVPRGTRPKPSGHSNQGTARNRILLVYLCTQS